MLRRSPEQISGKLKSMDVPNLRDAYVCRETVYNVIYDLPIAQLREKLIHYLSQCKTTRKPSRS